MAILVRPAVRDDLPWAEALVRDNMATYRTARGWSWDTERFHSAWRDTENFILTSGPMRVGLLRITLEQRGLYIRDVQVIPEYQRKGIGTFAVGFVDGMVRARGLSYIRLRVFRDNPASALYERLGFARMSESEGGLLRYEKRSP